MGLMTGSGPLGRKPAGAFNFETAGARAGRCTSSRRPSAIRVVVGGETIADSRRAMLLHESGHQPIYYFPPEDVRCASSSSRAIATRAARRRARRPTTRSASATTWSTPAPGTTRSRSEGAAAAGQGSDRVLLEPDGPLVRGGRGGLRPPARPVSPVDVLRTDRHVRVSLDGALLAESHARGGAVRVQPAAALVPAPRGRGRRARADATPSPAARTRGWRATTTVAGVSDGKDLIWYYPEPIAEAARINGLLCFFNERVDLELDGELRRTARVALAPPGLGRPARAELADVSASRIAAGGRPRRRARRSRRSCVIRTVGMPWVSASASRSRSASNALAALVEAPSRRARRSAARLRSTRRRRSRRRSR